MLKKAEMEYKKCRQFCTKYQDYERITNLMKYEPKLKSRQTKIRLELLDILENIIEED